MREAVAAIGEALREMQVRSIAPAPAAAAASASASASASAKRVAV
jgi:hypothetical protein